jgi:enoyl-[acyl-carrier protein] reductase I
MILKDKKILITGILTDKSIAYASAKIALENGATVVATGFGKGLRITERAAKRLSDDIKVFEMDIENLDQVNRAVQDVEKEVGNLDGILHAIAFSPTEAMGGNFLNTSVSDAVKSFEISAFSLKTLATSFQPILNKPASIVALDFDNSQAWPGYDWQGVAKSSLQSIVRYLGYYMGKDGVRVNAVAAGPLATTAAKNIPGFSEMNEEWNNRAPLGWDIKNTEPVAKVVNFLLSDFSEMVTGEIIHVDGGVHSIGGSMLPKN